MNKSFETKLIAWKHGWSTAIDVALMQFDFKLRRASYATVIFVEIADGLQPPPIAQLDATAAQTLMDQLWECGLRPTQGAGSAGAMAAVQRHLEDMRMLAFQKLNVTRPEKEANGR